MNQNKQLVRAQAQFLIEREASAGAALNLMGDIANRFAIVATCLQSGQAVRADDLGALQELRAALESYAAANNGIELTDKLLEDGSCL